MTNSASTFHKTSAVVYVIYASPNENGIAYRILYLNQLISDRHLQCNQVRKTVPTNPWDGATVRKPEQCLDSSTVVSVNLDR